MTKLAIIDFEPLLIEFFDDQKVKHAWVHPFIEQVGHFQPAEWDSSLDVDDEVFRVYLEDKRGRTVYIIFKSAWFEQKEAVPVSKIFLNSTFKLTGRELQSFIEAIRETLAGDTWVPAQPVETVVKNSRDYARLREEQAKQGAVQFCQSAFYEELVSYLDSDFKISFLSPDVCLHRDRLGGDYEWSS